ncbi:hypothetical protein H6501_02655 [Candidatus Woesearchaeota archaeon]|nr:hypothetical protein [Nanoarchaeota archaeon]MCB9370471.1 hypothetical protein [Candidatus Woesearchaeota archaeon]
MEKIFISADLAKDSVHNKEYFGGHGAILGAQLAKEYKIPLRLHARLGKDKSSTEYLLKLQEQGIDTQDIQENLPRLPHHYYEHESQSWTEETSKKTEGTSQNFSLKEAQRISKCLFCTQIHSSTDILLKLNKQCTIYSKILATELLEKTMFTELFLQRSSVLFLAVRNQTELRQIQKLLLAKRKALPSLQTLILTSTFLQIIGETPLKIQLEDHSSLFNEYATKTRFFAALFYYKELQKTTWEKSVELALRDCKKKYLPL